MLPKGHYAKKQILCKNKIIAWSHSSRFTTTRYLLEKYAHSNSKLLDYGCGDGTFLTTVRDLFPQAVGCDIASDQINDCKIRLSEVLPQASFRLINELNEEQYDSYFHIAVCMEVLEHCLPDVVDEIISNLKRLVKPGGLILISVPIEIGPSLLLKQILRAVAGWLRQGDYKTGFESYQIEDLWKMVFATKSTAIERNIYKANSIPYYGHHGFNWRSLREQLSQQFDIETTVFSPLGWLGGFVSSQVFFVCRNSKK